MPTPRTGRVRVAVLLSGAGSNMAALIDASRHADAPFEVVLVLSNKPDAGGLAIAGARGVATAVVAHAAFGKDRAAHEAAVQTVLETHGVEVVALAGYMRLLTPLLVGRWAGRMLNIHPSLLPKYPGLDTRRPGDRRRRRRGRLHRAPGRRGRRRRPGAWARPPFRSWPKTPPPRWRKGCWRANTGSIRGSSPTSAGR